MVWPVPTIATTPTRPAPSSNDWTPYHRDNSRAGYLASAPDPQRLRSLWSVQLDGAVYGEPLVIGGRVLVATEGDSLYSLDAQTGHILWHTNIGSPVPLHDLPCGNIDPLGITGTPVYDQATSLVFAVAEVSGFGHRLVGVDAGTGQVRVRRSADTAGIDNPAHPQPASLPPSPRTG